MAVILMYHSISRQRGTTSDARYVCAPARFARQLRLLRALGRRIVPLDEIVACLQEDRPLPSRAVAVTIDDGFRDAADEALPHLLACRAPATVFLATDYVGRCNAWMPRRSFAERAMLRRADVTRMHAAGIDFGGHTRTHPNLTKLGDELAWAEIDGCRRVLEDMLGAPVRHFAYPYGIAGERERVLVKEAGFQSACGIVAGRNLRSTDLFDLRRIEIRGTDSLAVFAAKVLLATDRLPIRARLGRSAWT
jgi:peptidoglycan/xylan/chitin deacetylase (PgdA/CDA1 family)